MKRLLLIATILLCSQVLQAQTAVNKIYVDSLRSLKAQAIHVPNNVWFGPGTGTQTGWSGGTGFKVYVQGQPVIIDSVRLIPGTGIALTQSGHGITVTSTVGGDSVSNMWIDTLDTYMVRWHGGVKINEASNDAGGALVFNQHYIDGEYPQTNLVNNGFPLPDWVFPEETVTWQEWNFTWRACDTLRMSFAGVGYLPPSTWPSGAYWWAQITVQIRDKTNDTLWYPLGLYYNENKTDTARYFLAPEWIPMKDPLSGSTYPIDYFTPSRVGYSLGEEVYIRANSSRGNGARATLGVFWNPFNTGIWAKNCTWNDSSATTSPTVTIDSGQVAAHSFDATASVTAPDVIGSQVQATDSLVIGDGTYDRPLIFANTNLWSRSYLYSAATARRSWLLPDGSGTLLTDSALTDWLKQPLDTVTVNAIHVTSVLPKKWYEITEAYPVTDPAQRRLYFRELTPSHDTDTLGAFGSPQGAFPPGTPWDDVPVRYFDWVDCDSVMVSLDPTRIWRLQGTGVGFSWSELSMQIYDISDSTWKDLGEFYVQNTTDHDTYPDYVYTLPMKADPGATGFTADHFLPAVYGYSKGDRIAYRVRAQGGKKPYYLENTVGFNGGTIRTKSCTFTVPEHVNDLQPWVSMLQDTLYAGKVQTETIEATTSTAYNSTVKSHLTVGQVADTTNGIITMVSTHAKTIDILATGTRNRDFFLPDTGANEHDSSATLVTEERLLALTNGIRSYITQPADKPPTTENALDDEFNGAAIDTTTKWTWLNKGAQTHVEQAHGWAIMYDTTAIASEKLRILQQTITDSTFTLTAKMTGENSTANYGISGITLGNTTLGRLVSFGTRWSSTGRTIAVVLWNSTTSFNSGTYSGAAVPGTMPVYFKVEKTSAVPHLLNFYVSNDGKLWGLFLSTATLSFAESAGNTIDRIGIMVDVNSATTLGVQQAFWWFRYNWTPDYNPITDY